MIVDKVEFTQRVTADVVGLVSLADSFSNFLKEKKRGKKEFGISM